MQPTTITSTATSTRFAFLDFLRFFAALAVAGYHFTAFNAGWAEPVRELFPVLSRFTKYGALGVELFFVISGFVILLSAYGRSIPAYTASRVARIFPAFWFAALFATFLYLVIWPEGRTIDLGQILTNLTMTHPASGIRHLDGVYWTLWVELRFYILTAFFLVWGITPRRILAVAFLWPLLASIALHQENSLLVTILISREAPLFAGGMVIFVMYKWGFTWTSLLVLLFNAFHAAYRSTGWLANAMRNNTGQVINDNYMILAILLIFAIVAVAVLTPLRRLSAPWMTWLGLFTYPLYLVHETLGWFLINKLGTQLSQHQTLTIVLTASFLLAYLVLRFIDQPGGRWLKRKMQTELEKLNP